MEGQRNAGNWKSRPSISIISKLTNSRCSRSDAVLRGSTPAPTIRSQKPPLILRCWRNVKVSKWLVSKVSPIAKDGSPLRRGAHCAAHDQKSIWAIPPQTHCPLILTTAYCAQSFSPLQAVPYTTGFHQFSCKSLVTAV